MINLLHANLALVLAVLSGYVIPAVSALLTKRPSGWTGLATTVLAAAAGFLGEWAASSDVDTYDWRAGLQAAIGALVLAFVGHKVTWQGTDTLARFYAMFSPTGYLDRNGDTTPPAEAQPHPSPSA